MQCSTLLEHQKSSTTASLDLTLPGKLEKKDNLGTSRGPCEDFLHTSTTKICTHKKPSYKWNYYVVEV
jgi:hypothetical protein